MKELSEYKEDIHKCSKCGLCQAACPVYGLTGNDCTVSRGQFIMLKGLLDGKLKMTKNLNRYLDLCLKCGKCSEYCPSGINVVEIISSAKYEYFKQNSFEKLKSFFQKYFVFGFSLRLLSFFAKNKKSKIFDKKVIYYGGCGSKLTGNEAVVNLLNNVNIEVITPNFQCCGVPYCTRGDFESLKECIDNYISILKLYEIREIVTSCASCEKAIKSYINRCDNDEDKKFLSEITVKNIYEYLRENNFTGKLKKHFKVTYHKPCNMHNYEDVEVLLNSIENLEYIKAEKYNQCCGLNGISKPKELTIMRKLFKQKRDDFEKTGAKIVLTSCMGCEAALNLYSKGKYKAENMISFLNKYTQKDSI